jgi:hypothetical protein
MSYSFSVTAKNKEDAKARVAEQIKLIVEHQEMHKVDEQATNNAVSAFVDLLGDLPEHHQLIVSVSGSVSWASTSGEGTPKNITGAGVNISARFQHI